MALMLCNSADRYLEEIDEAEIQIGVLGYMIQNIAILVGLSESQIYTFNTLINPLTHLLAKLTTSSIKGSAGLQLQ